MTTPITFEYTSVHGSLAAAYTSGALAAEFGPERVRVSLALDLEDRGISRPLLSEFALPEANDHRFDTRLLGVVFEAGQPLWALLCSHSGLASEAPLLVRALGAVLQARPHRKPMLDQSISDKYGTWVADRPLRAANILVTEDFRPRVELAA
jgi:hypothetical protein